MGQPQKREWTVDLRAEDPETGERFWDDEFAQERTLQAFLECATIQHREGGTFILAPLRTQIEAPQDSLAEGPIWANFGIVVQHTFTPPVKPRQTEAPADYQTHAAEQAAAQAEWTPFDGTPEPDMRDEDERVVAEALDEGDEPTAQPVPMAPDPVIERPDMDVDAERSRLDPADLMPKVQ